MEKLAAAGQAGVVGYESNGGFLVGSAIRRDGRMLAPLPTRDAVLPILALLAMSRERHVSVSGLAHDLPARFTSSDRIKDFATEKSRQLIQQLSASNEAIQQLVGELCGQPVGLDQTDGLRMSFDSGEIVHLRPSGNAPELRCYAEAGSQDRAKLLAQTVLHRVQSMA